MESSDEETQKRESLMEEAIKILNSEGFKLPGDVVDTLHSVSRSNAAARRRGPLRSHRMCEVQSNEKKIRNTRESSAKHERERSNSLGEENEDYKSTRQYSSEGASATSNNDLHSTSTSANGSSSSAKNKLEREESSESSSTCSASTVKEMPKAFNPKPLQRQDSASSIESSASSLNRKQQGHSRLESVGSDTGYSTSIENVVQSREAKAENLRNMNKTVENDNCKKYGNGLKRNISRDSGFTESGYAQNQQLFPGTARDAHAVTTKDFNDVSISKSDVSERFAASDSGEAHVVTSSATDLTAAQMTSQGEAITEDGSAVSSTSNLENQESNSTLLRVTDKKTDYETSKEDEYESVNKTTKSSRNDSVSTAESGLTTAASRHAASMEQGLYKERSKLSKSQDGSRVAADMSVDQQLSRNQEMNNTEQSNDGSGKVESRKISDRALTSKSLREEKLDSGDGSFTGSVSSSQNMDSKVRSTENDETITTSDGRVINKRQDSLTSSMNETTSSEQTTVKQLPYQGGSSKEIVKKSDSSSVSKTSRVRTERSETAGGVTENTHEEDSKSVSNSFSGTCESEENVNGLKLRRTQSTDKSSESNFKTSKSTSSHHNREAAFGIENNRRLGRTLSGDSDAASNYSGVSGLSRDSVKPPSYDETVSNLSRHGSHGSLNSVFSRQDSTASSIASSAGAFNERQKQKQLENERVSSFERNDSRDYDDDYTGRRGRTSRQDSYSSDSTITAGDRYQGREIVHPVRKIDTYERTHSDSNVGRNRRATLLGDVILTDRELQMAREDISSNLRGRDDSYVSSAGRYNEHRSLHRDDFDDFHGFGASSFKHEVMDMVDKFFDDDDDFGLGFGSGRRRSNRDRQYDKQLKSKRRDDNPYSLRQDLSKYDYSVETMKANLADTEYAASDSGYPVHRHRRNDIESDFSDIASESGHHRFSRNKNSYTKRDDYSNSDFRNPNRVHHGDAYRYSKLSERDAADDILQRAGKSIRSSDNVINASISDRSENITHIRKNNFNHLDDRNDRKYFSERDSEYSRRGRSDFDMTDGESTCNSIHSMPQHTSSVNQHYLDGDDFRTRSLPNINDSNSRFNRQQQEHSAELANGDQKQWDDRRHRIDKALTWIRSELGVLRTQDKVLMSQFQRCQDSIEELKKQRPWYEVFSDDDEEEEDGKHWEDWEIEDFDKAEGRDSSIR